MLVGFFKPVRIVTAFTDFRVDALLRIVVFMVTVVSTSMLVQS